MADSRISVRLSPELRGRLKTAARRSGMRESDLVREAVVLRLTSQDVETAADRLERAGLIGAVHGAPADLSTNKSHFDGFGRL